MTFRETLIIPPLTVTQVDIFPSVAQPEVTLVYVNPSPVESVTTMQVNLQGEFLYKEITELPLNPVRRSLLDIILSK
ncbi:hypothetical protein FKQ51_18445 [Bacillus toyonensis]|uniref:hypothetical protein n=1 Tax=Bacillus toyonensis TaxID=155322 RepID=UPI002703E5D1|nr:hypothetical protein [Bacillus toyonensis]MDO8159296.1 hypothetical protein [Bacillus toyonensis]